MFSLGAINGGERDVTSDCAFEVIADAGKNFTRGVDFKLPFDLLTKGKNTGIARLYLNDKKIFGKGVDLSNF